jgi:NAD(P)-dependent dehydrogenase (short-subunit alcohol dehydrogenase family)
MAGHKDGAVVVTGASTGIGRATALELDELGYTVFAGVRKQKDANSLKKEGSDRLTPITLDVTKERSIANAKQKVQRAVGKEGLVGLVNNAGVGGGGPVEFIPIDHFREVLDVNVVGQVAVTQAFLPLIRKAQGTIVFIASIGGRIAAPFLSPYSASKFGVEALGDSLRREVSPWGIDVVVVEPGSIKTEIWAKGQETQTEQLKQMPASARRLYGKQIKNWTKVFLVDNPARGIAPEKVADVIAKALRSNRPKPRYLVGTDAKVGAKLHAALPKRTFDRLVRRQMKFPKNLPAK